MIKKLFILLTIVAILIFISLWNYLIMPPNNTLGIVTFIVEEGSSITEIAQDLKEEGLIKSVTVFKLVIKLNKFNNFKAGHYQLSDNMTIKELASKINSGDVFYPNKVKITFPEGISLIEIAHILSENTNYSSKDIISLWNSDNYIQEAISKYEFITDDILNPAIEYPLNGYFFPDTYFLKSKDVSPGEVGFLLLDNMNRILNKHHNEIISSNYSIHEILTLASIIEYEAQRDEDRPIIAGVFINRLVNNMKLESCATLEMATGVHKSQYTNRDIQTDSPYNTYMYSGLPVGPGNSPGESSILSVLYPEDHDFYFFLSDIYGDNKVYYAKTLQEHNILKNKYLP